MPPDIFEDAASAFLGAKRPSNKKLNQSELADTLRQAGWNEKDIPVMSAIGMAESSGNPMAVNPGIGAGGKKTNEYSIGPWQINTLAHPQYDKEQLKDPLYNAKAALDVFNKQGLRAWGAFTDGRYKKYYTDRSGKVRPMGDPFEGAANAYLQSPEPTVPENTFVKSPAPIAQAPQEVPQEVPQTPPQTPLVNQPLGAVDREGLLDQIGVPWTPGAVSQPQPSNDIQTYGGLESTPADPNILQNIGFASQLGQKYQEGDQPSDIVSRQGEITPQNAANAQNASIASKTAPQPRYGSTVSEGQEIPDDAEALPNGGYIRAPREIGKPSDDPNGIVVEYGPPPQEKNPENALRDALLSAGHGITPQMADDFVQKTKSQYGGVLNDPIFKNWKPGTPISITWNNLKQAGVPDTQFQNRSEQAQTNDIVPRLDTENRVNQLFGSTREHAKWLNDNFGSLGSSIVGGLAAVGADTARSVGGAAREVGLDGLYDTLKNVSDTGESLYQHTGDGGDVSGFVKGAVRLGGAAGRVYIMVAAPTMLLAKAGIGLGIAGHIVASSIAVGADSDFQAAGSGATREEIDRQRNKGLALGAILGAAPIVGNIAERLSGATSTLGKAAVREGTTGATIFGGSVGVDKAAGDDWKQSLWDGATNTLVHFATLGANLIGKTVALRDAKGRTTYVGVDAENNVRALKGEVENPDIVMYFNEKTGKYEADFSKNATKPTQPEATSEGTVAQGTKETAEINNRVENKGLALNGEVSNEQINETKPEVRPPAPLDEKSLVSDKPAEVQAEAPAKKVEAPDLKNLTVYRGTRHDDVRVSEEGGIFFSDKPEIAKQYIHPEKGGKVVSATLDIKNPKIIEGDTSKYTHNYSDDIATAKQEGYDGLIIRNTRDLLGGIQNQYVAFSPEQVKFTQASKEATKGDNAIESQPPAQSKSEVESSKYDSPSDFFKDKIGDKWYVAPRPLKKYADSDSVHVTPKRYAELEKEFNESPSGVAYQETLKKAREAAKPAKIEKTSETQPNKEAIAPANAPNVKKLIYNAIDKAVKAGKTEIPIGSKYVGEAHSWVAEHGAGATFANDDGKLILRLPSSEGSATDNAIAPKTLDRLTRSKIKRELGENPNPEDITRVAEKHGIEKSDVPLLGPKGEYGQTSYFIRRALLSPENNNLEDLIQSTVPEALGEDNKVAVNAILDDIGDAIGKKRSSTFDDKDWNKYLDTNAHKVPKHFVELVEKALLHQSEYFGKQEAYLNSIAPHVDSIMDQIDSGQISTFKQLPPKVKSAIIKEGRRHELSEEALRETFNTAISGYLKGGDAEPRGITKSDTKDQKVEAKSGPAGKTKLDDIQFQTAWHGSPHTFDKFRLDSSTIGTGEGAQAYGHGLYFTDQESIAEYYKNELSHKHPTRFEFPDGRVLDSHFKFNSKNLDPIEKNAVFALGSVGYDTARKTLTRLINDPDFASRKVEFTETLAKVNQWEKEGVKVILPAGAKYKVNLKPNEEDYLLWDKPLSEQSDVVKQSLKKALSGDLLDEMAEANMTQNTAEHHEDPDVKGGELYKDLQRVYGNKEEVSDLLKENGIRGIKYLDGSSRSKGEGNYNYVIFDDKDVEILDVQRQADASKIQKEVKRYIGLIPKALAKQTESSVDGRKLLVNPQGAALLHRAIKDSGGESHDFTGFQTTDRNAQILIKHLKGYGDTDELVKNIEKAIDNPRKDFIVLVKTKDIAPHEKTVQEEETHSADEFTGISKITGYNSPAYKKAMTNLPEMGYAGKSPTYLHREVIGKIQTDYAGELLGLTDAEVDELQTEHVMKVVEAGKSGDDFLKEYKGISKQSERFIENVQRRNQESNTKGSETVRSEDRRGEALRPRSSESGKPTIQDDAGRFAKFRQADISGKGESQSLTKQEEKYISRGSEEYERNLKKWLGDSVVRKPLYHGTSAKTDFPSFRAAPNDIGIHLGTEGQANDRLDFKGRNTHTPHERIIPVYARLENPLRTEDAGWWDWHNVPHVLKKTGKFSDNEIRRLEHYPEGVYEIEAAYKEENGIDPEEDDYGYEDTLEYKELQEDFAKETRSLLEKHGYDGIVYRNTGEVKGAGKVRVRPEDVATLDPDEYKRRKAIEDAYTAKHAEDSYIVLHPSQIKSAIGNRGTFDTLKDEILLSKVGDEGTKDAILSALRSAKDVAVDLLNAPRAIKASTDLSAIRQAGLLIPANPILAAKSFAKSLRMLPPKSGAKKYADFKRDLDLHPYIELAESSKLHLTSLGEGSLNTREEAFMSRILGNDPYFRNKALETGRKLITFPVRTSERAYVAMLDKFRLDVFAKLSKQVHEFNVRKGKEDASKQYEQLADFINKATGRGDLGRLNDFAPILNSVFFSPRFWASRLQVMNPAFYAKLPPGTRGAVLKNVMAFVGAVGLTALLLKSLGFKVEEDPTDKDGLKLRMGNFSYDLSFGLMKHIKYAARMVMATQGKDKRPAEEKMTYLTKQYLRSSLAPLPSAAWSSATGKNFIGEPTDTKSEALNLLKPIPVDNFYDAVKAQGLEGLVKASPDFFGISTTRYRTKEELRQKIAEESDPAKQKQWRSLLKRAEN
jgi:hypothetical protein